MYKSRELLVYLHPDQFLGLAWGLPETQYSIDNIVKLTSLMRGGTKMYQIPELYMDQYGRIVDHNGRHRANALRQMGYQKMPVRLISNDFIRWSQQADPNKDGYIQRLPDLLISQEGNHAMPVPFETEGPRRGMARSEYADSTKQGFLIRPRYTWGGSSVWDMDYEAKLLPEFGSEAYFNADYKTQKKAEVRAILNRDIELGREIRGDNRAGGPSRLTIKAYEEFLDELYSLPAFREISVGFVEQARNADGQPFHLGSSSDRYDLQELAEQELVWDPTQSKAEILQRKEEILKQNYEQQILDEAADRELEAKRLAEELEEQRMLATLTPQERAAYFEKKNEETTRRLMDLLLFQEQPEEPRMADDMVDVYGRKLTEEQALKELADLEEQLRVTAPDSRAYNELRGEVRLLDRALENYYTQVPATTDIFGDPVETRRPDPSDFLEDPVVTRTMETGLPEDFGPPRTMRDPLANVPPEYREAVRNPTPTVRGDTKTFTDAFDLFANQDDELLMTMRRDPALEEVFELYDDRLYEVRRIQRELAERPSRSVRNMLLDQLEDAKANLASAERTLQQRAQQFNERVASAIAEPRIEDEVFGREMETQRQERQVMRGEAAQRGSSRTGLSAMLESEGIPRDSFLDFMELPENRRSGKSIPQLIEDYKIAGELPGSAGMSAGRPRRAMPAEGLASDPILQSGTYTDEFGETVRRPTSLTVSPTSDQRAFSALDPETGLRVFTPTEVEAEEDILMRGLFADEDLMEGVAEGLDMSPEEYRRRVREQADLYDELLQRGRTPAIAFNDPIQRSAYEIAEQRQIARRGEPRTLRRTPDSPSRNMTLERRPGSRSIMQFVRDAAEEGQPTPTASDVLPTGPRSRLQPQLDPSLLAGSTLTMDPETGDFSPSTPSGQRQMIVGGSNIPDDQMIVSGRNLDAGSGPVFRGIEGPPDPPRMESGQRQMVIGERRQARPDDLGYSEPELARVRDLAREGQTEAAQGAVRGAAELEPDKVRMAVDRPLLRSTTGRLGFDPTIAPDPGSGRRGMPLSAKFIATAEQARDLLADPEIEAKIAPKQLSRIRELALKAAPALRAAGNAALAGELLYYSVKERSVPGGVMAAGAAAVEGTGALMGLPAALAESAIPGYGEDLEIAGTVIPKRNPGLEIAAAAGRGIQSTVGAYGRERERKRNREIYQDATEFGVRVLGLDQDSAMRRGKEYMKAYHSAIERGEEPPPINSDLGLRPLQDEALMNGMR